MTRITTGLLIAILASVAPPEALALIFGGVGNEPITDPGWPTGAAAIFNHTGRIAWWEGPPLGGGQWHAECRGDARALNAVLADFARMDAKVKRVVVHDGTGHSFWLAPNHEVVPLPKEKREASKIDWVFMVWQPANWEHLRKLPADLNPTELADTSPPSQIDVFTAGINWADVTVPEGIEVIDQRLVAHGFTAEDGVVLEGKVTDFSTRQPIAAAVRLQRVEPQEKAGYRYTGFDLRLMSSLNDVSGIPTEGKYLIIVAAVNNVLHIRIFDGDGKVVADTDEKRLTGQARQIEDLRKQLESAWPPREMTKSDKVRVVNAVTSIVGHIRYTVVAETKADAQGHWVLKKAPAGWICVVVEAAGFVPNVAGYARSDDQPRWQSYDCGLARPATVSGRITDDAGKPLEGVDVRLDDVQPESGGHYASPLGYEFKTDAEGRFRAEQVPKGTATIWLHKPGYCRPGLGLPITTPKGDVEMQMMKAASVRVTVDFTGKERPEGYMVSIAPEGGEAIGSYGGSGNIDAKNQMTFEIVPSGRYVLRGRPNPGSDAEETEPVTVDLKGGQASEVTLKAK